MGGWLHEISLHWAPGRTRPTAAPTASERSRRRSAAAPNVRDALLARLAALELPGEIVALRLARGAGRVRARQRRRCRCREELELRLQQRVQHLRTRAPRAGQHSYVRAPGRARRTVCQSASVQDGSPATTTPFTMNVGVPKTPRVQPYFHETCACTHAAAVAAVCHAIRRPPPPRRQQRRAGGLQQHRTRVFQSSFGSFRPATKVAAERFVDAAARLAMDAITAVGVMSAVCGFQ